MRVDLSALRWLLPHFKGSRRFWVIAALATAITSATEPVVPDLLRRLLDNGFAGSGLPLWVVPATLMGLFAVRGAAGFIADMALARLIQDALLSLRRAMFERVLHARLSLFDKETATSLSNTVVFEMQSGSWLLVNAVMAMVKDGLSVLALLAYLFYLNWQLTLVVFTVVPGVGIIMRTLSRRLYRIARSTQTATNDLAYVVEENVLAARVVRLHNGQQGQAKRFFGLSQVLRRLALKSAAAQAAITPLTHMLAAMALSVVVTIALWQADKGISVGTFTSFVTAMLMLIAPIKRLSEVASPISRGMAAIQRGIDLIEQTPLESTGSHAVVRAEGHLHLQQVTVRYRGAAAPAIDGIDLDIRPGQVVALVGPSGSGKTTLANLLPRFVAPDSGQVLLDGVELGQWALAALRRQFALVSQDVVMFNESLARNVSLEEAPDRDRVMRCLEAANLGDLVASLPQGLDTFTGHNATELSGGQRQRLAIARALYKDAPILLLDEATSALDAASERLIQEALKRLMAGRTTLIIAHRLSTIEHADRVVVLDQGRVVESGPHAQLLAMGGLYARLHALQAGTTVPAKPATA
jgi:subfamily B ATP-binding cassette protein MsbA